VVNGPGSFTGLRIGISTVKGLAVTHNIPCIGVSTLEALAMNMIMTEGATVCSLMDARRGEFYNGIFRVEKNQLIRISEDRAIPGSKIAEELTSFEKVYLLGDGALKFAGQFARFSDCLVDETLRFQSGKSVARLGLSLLRGSEAISCKELSPKYLRLPQAEREWNEKNKNS
jgi:tRNA threonylcarbamoyladenosine biosynthesis protein TsaB